MAYVAPTFVNGGPPAISAENLNALAQTAEENQTFLFENVTVTAGSFVSDATFETFPFRAAIPLAGITAQMIPNVIFSPTDAAAGMYAPVCQSYDGGVYIYAITTPAGTVTIPTITAKKGVS